MDRRNFIRLAGGGVVAAAAATTVSGCSFGTAYPPVTLEAWNGPGAESEPRRRALAYALTAPNPHNRQAWLVDLREPGVVTLMVDRRRLLPETDPLGRQVLIGHGAFLELLVMGLAEQGLRGDVAVWPHGELPEQLKDWDDRPVARITLVSGAQKDPLFAQVLLRHTPKIAFDTARPVTTASLKTLIESVPAGCLRADGTVDAGRLESLRALCSAADDTELLTARTVMESLRLTRIGPDEISGHRDGISIMSPMARLAAAAGMFDRTQPPAKGSNGFAQMQDFTAALVRSAMGFVWIVSPGNSRAQQLAAGRAYLRLQLKATELGVGVHPLSQSLQEYPEMAPHRARAHQLLIGEPAFHGPGSETVQMLCRIGYTPAPASATPRRPLDHLLVA